MCGRERFAGNQYGKYLLENLDNIEIPDSLEDNSKMKKSFALRVDSDVYDAIERWAADEFRSTNGQIEWILSEALKKAKRYPKKKASEKEEK